MAYSYSDYLGTNSNLAADVGTPSAPMAMGATTHVASGGLTAPQLMGASFLVNYLAAKAAQFEKRKQQEMDNQKNYQNDQEQALNSLNNTWKSALLK